MKYANPILPGFNPDPSICRVGDDYYLATSSFEYFPGVPIYHSRDLINWRVIGHCLTRKSQLDLDKVPCPLGVWAPTIRHHNGRFYMVTRNMPKDGHFYVYADDPSGEWSEPIWVDQCGIDPSLFFDDDGKVYFTSNGQGGIYQCEIDIETGAKLSETKFIWTGTGGAWPEAPHLYKINGRYYLMIAEGGTYYGHMETIARSDSPWGPWETCPHNPILTLRDAGRNNVHGAGHADIMEAADGSWWMVFLAFRTTGPLTQHLGRETYLAPVTWDENGWPVVYGGRQVGLEMEAERLPAHPMPPASVRDDFDGESLDLEWNYIRNPRIENYSPTERPGWLRLHGSAVTLDDVDTPTFLGRRQKQFDCRATALLDFEPAVDGEEAGLTVIANNTHHYEIAVTREDGQKKLIVRRRIGDLSVIVTRIVVPTGPVKLEIGAEKLLYTFRYAVGGGPMIDLTTAHSRYLSIEVADTFTGTYFGIYTTGNGNPCTVPADFDWFEHDMVASCEL